MLEVCLKRAREACVWTGLLIALSASSCKQTEGDTCQIDSDCEGSLVCCIVPNTTARGSCGVSHATCNLQTDTTDSTDAPDVDAGPE